MAVLPHRVRGAPPDRHDRARDRPADQHDDRLLRPRRAPVGRVPGGCRRGRHHEQPLDRPGRAASTPPVARGHQLHRPGRLRRRRRVRPPGGRPGPRGRGGRRCAAGDRFDGPRPLGRGRAGHGPPPERLRPREHHRRAHLLDRPPDHGLPRLPAGPPAAAHRERGDRAGGRDRALPPAPVGAHSVGRPARRSHGGIPRGRAPAARPPARRHRGDGHRRSLRQLRGVGRRLHPAGGRLGRLRSDPRHVGVRVDAGRHRLRIDGAGGCRSPDR